MKMSATSDPFSNWRRQTGRTSVRGDYDDGHANPHKKIAEAYGRFDRPLSSAAKFAAQHPGGHPKHYVRRMSAESERRAEGLRAELKKAQTEVSAFLNIITTSFSVK